MKPKMATPKAFKTCHTRTPRVWIMRQAINIIPLWSTLFQYEHMLRRVLGGSEKLGKSWKTFFLFLSWETLWYRDMHHDVINEAGGKPHLWRRLEHYVPLITFSENINQLKREAKRFKHQCQTIFGKNKRNLR